jgi:hypothetical protein
MPSSITVNKLDLILKIQEERDKHEALYNEAVKVYKKRFVQEAEKFARDAVDRMENGLHFVDFVWLPVPEKHTEDFDRAIEMLQWEVNDTVKLSENDFTTLVLNQWGWARSFASNTSSYIPGA